MNPFAIKKVIVPIDLSHISLNALDTAFALARKHGLLCNCSISLNLTLLAWLMNMILTGIPFPIHLMSLGHWPALFTIPAN